MKDELKGVVSIDLTKAPELPANYKSIEATAKAFQVVTAQDYEQGAAMISGAAAAIAKVEAFFESDKSMAHKLHKSICDKISSITAPWRSIRANIEPRMLAYLREEERKRQEAERAAQAEATRLRVEAENKARAIQDEAARAASALRQQGEMKAAREAQEAAQRQAVAVIEQAQDAAELGVVLPDTKIEGGPSESRPWIGEVADMRALCRAIGGEVNYPKLAKKLSQMGFPTDDIACIISESRALVESISLEYDGTKGETLPLLVVNQSLLNHIAKRWGQADIGLPGCIGKRGLTLRFGQSKGSAAPQGDEF